MNLYPTAVRRVPAPALHERTAGVIDVGILFRHGEKKLSVHGFEYGVRTSEISGKIERRSVLFRFKAALFFGKKDRFAAPKAVNRLFDIPDEKNILSAHGGKDSLLYGIDVLIFVHEYHGGISV